MGKKRKIRVFVARLLGIAVLLVAGTIVFLGWRWVTTMRCTYIEITRAKHAQPEEVIALAHVDTGMVLFDIDPVLVRDRVTRHAWIRDAEVTRLPNGTLRIALEERIPVVLTLDRNGSPAYYLDADGYIMPVVSGAVYDVPLLKGYRIPDDPLQPVEASWLLDLVGALPELDEDTHALISELEVRAPGDLWLHVSPVEPHGSIPVRLGQGEYLEKLTRLAAFWEQAVLTQPDKRFMTIDLRFDSQVVTNEKNINENRPQ